MHDHGGRQLVLTFRIQCADVKYASNDQSFTLFRGRRLRWRRLLYLPRENPYEKAGFQEKVLLFVGEWRLKVSGGLGIARGGFVGVGILLRGKHERNRSL
jgi:hypothetical protein